MDDPELSLAFILFIEKGILPGQFYAMHQGEKIILSAFMNKLTELRRSK